MSKTQETQPVSSPVVSIDLIGAFGQFMNLEGLLMFSLMGALILLSMLAGKGKGKLTSGRMARTAEITTALTLAFKQMKNQKCQPVTLWSGTPRYWFKGNFKFFSAYLQTLLGSPPTVWFPNAERGLLVIGAPGSGKTFSVIDRAIESSFVQGCSTLVFDKKGDQLELHAALASRYGYTVEVFAPGEKYSGTINPLDFMNDETDSVMAGEIGRVVAQNADLGSDKGDQFFRKNGEMLATGLVQLAKSSPYPDLAMVYAFIQLPNFVERIYHAVHRPANHPKKMNRWIATSFSTLLSSKDAEKTVAGIKTTAESTYSAFIQKDLLRAFIGKSTIPIRLDGKQLIIFKLDDKRRSVIAPLLASAIHLCVVSNLATKRKNPFVYSLDEFPAIKLNRIVNWVNEYRSNGGVPIVGIQSLNQLFDSYGDKQGASIASALSTHVLFNPGDWDTADKYSKRYGEVELVIRNRSVGDTTGAQATRTITWNDQIHKKPLISADEILRFPQGRCVITSPAYGSSNEALFPYKLKIPVSKADIKRATESESLWHTHIRPQLEERARLHSNDVDSDKELDKELEKRLIEAQKMLPLSDEPDEPLTTNQQPPTNSAPSDNLFETFQERMAEVKVT